MKPLSSIIENLRDFKQTTKDNPAILAGLLGVLIIVYEVDEEEEQYSMSVRAFTSASDAMMSFADTACYDSCVKVWPLEKDNDLDEKVNDIDTLVTDFIAALLNREY